MLTHFWYEPLLLFRDYFKKSYSIYFLEILKGLGITFVSIILAREGSSWLVPQNWSELILKGIIVSIVSLIVIVLCYRKTEGYALMYQKIKSILAIASVKLLKKRH